MDPTRWLPPFLTISGIVCTASPSLPGVVAHTRTLLQGIAGKTDDDDDFMFHQNNTLHLASVKAPPEMAYCGHDGCVCCCGAATSCGTGAAGCRSVMFLELFIQGNSEQYGELDEELQGVAGGYGLEVVWTQSSESDLQGRMECLASTADEYQTAAAKVRETGRPIPRKQKAVSAGLGVDSGGKAAGSEKEGSPVQDKCREEPAQTPQKDAGTRPSLGHNWAHTTFVGSPQSEHSSDDEDELFLDPSRDPLPPCKELSPNSAAVDASPGECCKCIVS